MIRRTTNEYKCSVMLYHKNILAVYKKYWIEKCILSLANQSFTDFDSFELNYGDDDTTLEKLTEINFNPGRHFTLHVKQENHVHAMNYLLDLLLNSRNYDIVFNVNLDDYYDRDRFIHQREAIHSGWDLVSTEFDYVKEDEHGIDRPFQQLRFGNVNINIELNRGNNVLCHPSIAYTRQFWSRFGPYTDNIPIEDMLLWKNAINNGASMHIVPKILTHYRIHEKQITAQYRSKELFT